MVRSSNNEIPRTVVFTFFLLLLLCTYGNQLLRNMVISNDLNLFLGATHYCDMIGLLLNTNWHSSCVQPNLFGSIFCCCYCWKYKHAAYEWKTQTIFRSLRMRMCMANTIYLLPLRMFAEMHSTNQFSVNLTVFSCRHSKLYGEIVYQSFYFVATKLNCVLCVWKIQT